MLRCEDSNEWGLITKSHDVRLAASVGTSITPGENAYGTYVTVLDGATGGPGGGATEEAFGISLAFNSGFTATAARDILIDVQIGGVSRISHLLASGASEATKGGVRYYFPIRIPAGLDIDMAASVNNATVGTINAQCAIYCRPSRPYLVRAGTYVRSFGEDTANSRGTLVTPGTTAEGAWTQLGSAIAAGDDLWWWQVGVGINDGTINSHYLVDASVGDASNKRLAIQDELVFTASNEAIMKTYGHGDGYERKAGPGELVYGRAQSSTTPDTEVSMIAYAVGG